MSIYISRGTPFLYTPVVAFVPVLLDFVQPRYLYSADAEMFVFASVVFPFVLAYKGIDNNDDMNEMNRLQQNINYDDSNEFDNIMLNQKQRLS